MSDDAALRLAFAAMAPDRVDRLVDRLGGIENVVDAVVARRLRLSDRISAAVAVPAGQRRGELAGMAVTFSTEPLPGLDGVPGAPRWMFLKGSIPDGERVAVIGSRRASAYGLGIADRIGSVLANQGRIVVSGLARGIDAAAHRGVVGSGGRGVAVLGSGIDVWYPRQNRALGERIVETGGSVVSEFPPGTLPEAWRFPHRNRIIAALSSVVVVVEAAVRSGALITARLALELGREVFAIPGDIDRSTSMGCNLLIRDGAFPITSIDEMCEAIDSVVGPSEPGHIRDASPLLGIIGAVPMALDDVVSALGRPVAEIMTELSRLEARGEIVFESGMVGWAPSLLGTTPISTLESIGGPDSRHARNGTN